MSEENQNRPEVSIGFVGSGQQITIQFADGVHIIPERVVAELGKENLEKIAPALKQKTFGEFLFGFNLMIQKRAVNSFQQQFISNHFNRRF